MKEVVCKIEGCGVCHEDTVYYLQFLDDGKILLRVEGCNNRNKRWNTGFTTGREFTLEEGLHLLREHADHLEQTLRFYQYKTEDTNEALIETKITVAELERRWMTPAEFRKMVAPLVKKYHP